MALKNAELYDPLTGNWTTTGSMHHARGLHTASVLPDGKVLVSGGSKDNHYANGLKSAELYDPSTGKWTNTSSMYYLRWSHTASVLENGNVLVVGSSVESSTADTAELYKSSTLTF
jgi:N-acetylneuraminic acid mutarotase